MFLSGSGGHVRPLKEPPRLWSLVPAGSSSTSLHRTFPAPSHLMQRPHTAGIRSQGPPGEAPPVEGLNSAPGPHCYSLLTPDS
jgi:hypothetical protein